MGTHWSACSSLGRQMALLHHLYLRLCPDMLLYPWIRSSQGPCHYFRCFVLSNQEGPYKPSIVTQLQAYIFDFFHRQGQLAVVSRVTTAFLLPPQMCYKDLMLQRF